MCLLLLESIERQPEDLLNAVLLKQIKNQFLAKTITSSSSVFVRNSAQGFVESCNCAK